MHFKIRLGSLLKFPPRLSTIYRVEFDFTHDMCAQAFSEQVAPFLLLAIQSLGNTEVLLHHSLLAMPISHPIWTTSSLQKRNSGFPK